MLPDYQLKFTAERNIRVNNIKKIVPKGLNYNYKTTSCN